MSDIIILCRHETCKTMIKPKFVLKTQFRTYDDLIFYNECKRERGQHFDLPQ